VKSSLLRPILLVLLLISVVMIACSNESKTSSNTTGMPGPPSSKELAAQGFLYPKLPRVTCEQLKQMLDKGEPLVVVDTRTEFFFKQGHIPQAINIVYSPKIENPEGFLALPKDRPIIFYCD
jgi:3-mercaptopyruvate sulfurtransferase SseA